MNQYQRQRQPINQNPPIQHQQSNNSDGIFHNERPTLYNNPIKVKPQRLDYETVLEDMSYHIINDLTTLCHYQNNNEILQFDLNKYQIVIPISVNKNIPLNGLKTKVFSIMFDKYGIWTKRYKNFLWEVDFNYYNINVYIDNLHLTWDPTHDALLFKEIGKTWFQVVDIFREEKRKTISKRKSIFMPKQRPKSRRKTRRKSSPL